MPRKDCHSYAKLDHPILFCELGLNYTVCSSFRIWFIIIYTSIVQNMRKNRCMHAAVCLLHAGQLNRAGNVAKSGEFLGEFSWEELFPMDVRVLFNTIDEAVV